MSESDSESSLRLTLSPPGSRSYPDRPESSQQTASGSHSVSDRPDPSQQSSLTDDSERGSRRPRRVSGDRFAAAKSKDELIPPPYPWSTDRRAVVQSLDWMMASGINRIYGEVSCKKCDNHMVEVDLQSAFYRLSTYFLANRDSMHDRAPRLWTSPKLLTCGICHQGDHAKPIVHTKKRSINWLFLLLTETLGVCTLEQLKYFCKHTRKHRTGAKDRVLYLTYSGLLKQLNPAGPY